jgi:hypothetical protein
MTVFLKMVLPFVTGFFQRKEVKELVVTLLEKYAKTTDNDIDDTVVEMVRKALL